MHVAGDAAPPSGDHPLTPGRLRWQHQDVSHRVRQRSDVIPAAARHWLQGRRKLARAQRRGNEQRRPVAVGAIVSNHVGYTDVLVSTGTPGCRLLLACRSGGGAAV